MRERDPQYWERMNDMIESQARLVANDPRSSDEARANATGSPFSNQDSLEVSETQPQIEEVASSE